MYEDDGRIWVQGGVWTWESYSKSPLHAAETLKRTQSGVYCLFTILPKIEMMSPTSEAWEQEVA